MSPSSSVMSSTNHPARRRSSPAPGPARPSTSRSAIARHGGDRSKFQSPEVALPTSSDIGIPAQRAAEECRGQKEWRDGCPNSGQPKKNGNAALPFFEGVADDQAMTQLVVLLAEARIGAELQAARDRGEVAPNGTNQHGGRVSELRTPSPPLFLTSVFLGNALPSSRSSPKRLNRAGASTSPRVRRRW